MNKVEMFANGKIYSGWTSCKITRSIKAIAGSFSLTVSNNWASKSKGWILSPLDEVVIYIDSKKVITGYIDKIGSSFDSSDRSISVSGRDKTADLVDCSYVGPSTLEGLNLHDFISKVIKPFGLTFRSEVALPQSRESYSSQQGETCFAFLERILKLRGFLLTSDAEGNLVISKIGSSRSTTALHEGVNCHRANFDFDAAERFSHYIVKGQSKGSEEEDPEQSTQVEASYIDVNVKRYRPLVIMAEGEVDRKKAFDRAKWEAIIRSAKSSVLKVDVKGWKKADGSLWLDNEIVNFQSKYFGFNIDLLMTEVSYEISATDGPITQISLENKDAYKIASEAKKERDIWKELSPQ